MNMPIRLRLKDFVAEALKTVEEVFPWDIEEVFRGESEFLVVDIRQPYEYDKVHIKNSILVPRGVLEASADFGFEESVEELAQAREREVLVVCRSGTRSLLAARTLQMMGFKFVKSLKTGMKGAVAAQLPLYNQDEKLISKEEEHEYFYSGHRSLFRRVKEPSEQGLGVL